LDPKAKTSGLLEKKWTSVVRLQKKVRRRSLVPLSQRTAAHERFVRVVQIMDLETRNSHLTEELASAPTKRPSASSTDWTPRAPARYSLAGHRSPITRVTFHPLYSQLVSASEDASMKVWDWESGEMERTIKGHTKPVQDVDFDSKGDFLGEDSIREVQGEVLMDGRM
jgi:platelet-activating factor acetylhydrolase IB subunit alpha